MADRLIEAFPADDREALFMVAMCMASNDVEAALREVGEIRDGMEEDPTLDERRRWGYRIRMLNGHLWEAIVALKAWRQSEPQIATLLRGLGAEPQRSLKLVMGLADEIGTDALRGMRNHSFHYPHPGTDWSPDPVDDLAACIRAEADRGIEIDGSDDGLATFLFADEVAFRLALSGHDPGLDLSVAQGRAIRDAAEAFVEVIGAAFSRYCRRRGVEFEAQT
jgi:hypothetical protein